MAPIAYVLCAATSTLCAFLLLRAYRVNGHGLLLWSGLCFVGLTLNNILLVVDRVVFPNDIDLSTWRLIPALGGLTVLLYGLIWDER